MDKTMILAIGNAGGNIAETIFKLTNLSKLKGAQYVFADCDENDLKKHIIYKCRLMYVNLPQDPKDFSNNFFNGVKDVVIIAGLGGETGSRFIEQAILRAKLENVKHISVVVTLPFSFEGKERRVRAESCLKVVKDIADIHLIVLENDKLFDKYGELDMRVTLNSVDKVKVNTCEEVIKKKKSNLSHIKMGSQTVEENSKTMYVFSTADTFKNKIENKIQGYLSKVSRIEIYLFNCKEDFNPKFESMFISLKLQLPAKVKSVEKVFNLPVINSQDIIIDAIGNDPGLHPLVDGFLALETFISESDAEIYRV